MRELDVGFCVDVVTSASVADAAVVTSSAAVAVAAAAVASEAAAVDDSTFELILQIQ